MHLFIRLAFLEACDSPKTREEEQGEGDNGTWEDTNEGIKFGKICPEEGKEEPSQVTSQLNLNVVIT